MSVHVGVVRCVLCGGNVRLIAPGQLTPDGPGERCGELERAEGRLDDWEEVVRECRARRRGQVTVAIQHALPAQGHVRPRIMREEKKCSGPA